MQVRMVVTRNSFASLIEFVLRQCVLVLECLTSRSFETRYLVAHNYCVGVPVGTQESSTVARHMCKQSTIHCREIGVGDSRECVRCNAVFLN